MENDIIRTEVYRKANKSLHIGNRKSQKRYKRNAISGDIYRSWRMSSNFHHEKNKISNKFLTAGYPRIFVNRMINDPEIKSMTQWYPFIHLFITHLIDVSFCNENKKVSNRLLKKLEAFTKESIILELLGKPRKTDSFFSFQGQKLMSFM